jgi:hypothetical protein
VTVEAFPPAKNVCHHPVQRALVVVLPPRRVNFLIHRHYSVQGAQLSRPAGQSSEENFGLKEAADAFPGAPPGRLTAKAANLHIATPQTS